MKIFQDKGKTILPRVDSMFLLSRVLTLIAALWIVFSIQLPRQELMILAILTATYTITLVLFQSLVRIGKHDLKRPYFAIILFELIFVTALIRISGGYSSNFFLLYYLTVGFAAYLMTFPATLILAGISSFAYLVLVSAEIKMADIVDLVIRIGFMWLLALVIAFVSDYIRRSEKRLLKLFDTLNQRTAELEKSQVHLEMIYEHSRILSGILDVKGVIDGVMKITGDILAYPASGLLLTGQGDTFVYHGRNIGGQKNLHLKAVDKEKMGLVSKVSKQSGSVIVNDISERDDYKPLRKTTHSLMLVPMVVHGKASGVLTAESPQVGAFSEKDLKMLSVLARSAAIAIENANLHRQMEELTITDELTGIYNYRYFAMKLKEEQRRAARYNLPLSLIMLDIDWFKTFNDNYGHEVGNIVLKGITAVVKECIRDVDIFARYGGEEFVIILPQTPNIEVTKIGERIRQQIDETLFSAGTGAGDLRVTVSVGVTSFPENGKPHEELLSIADQALYRAKGSGKNRVCVI